MNSKWITQSVRIYISYRLYVHLRQIAIVWHGNSSESAQFINWNVCCIQIINLIYPFYTFQSNKNLWLGCDCTAFPYDDCNTQSSNIVQNQNLLLIIYVPGTSFVREASFRKDTISLNCIWGKSFSKKTVKSIFKKVWSNFFCSLTPINPNQFSFRSEQQQQYDIILICMIFIASKMYWNHSENRTETAYVTGKVNILTIYTTNANPRIHLHIWVAYLQMFDLLERVSFWFAARFVTISKFIQIEMRRQKYFKHLFGFGKILTSNSITLYDGQEHGVGGFISPIYRKYHRKM